MGIFKFKETIDKAVDIIDQAVVDQDKSNELKFLIQSLEHDMRLAELGTVTVPWVDALHKMGRQIISLASIIAIVVLKLYGIDLSMEEMVAMGGAGVAYNVIKGRGN